MKHFFISQERAPDTWREAFPDLQLLTPGQLPQLAKATQSLIWYRLARDEAAAPAIARLKAHTSLPIIILRDEPDDAEIPLVVEAGALAYCNTRSAPKVLRQISAVVQNDGLWVGQTLLQRLIGGVSRVFAQQQARTAALEWQNALSEREIQVARHVAAGASNKEIAERLGITERTVKAHLTAIFDKLAVRDRLQLSLKINGPQE